MLVRHKVMLHIYCMDGHLPTALSNANKNNKKCSWRYVNTAINSLQIIKIFMSEIL